MGLTASNLTTDRLRWCLFTVALAVSPPMFSTLQAAQTWLVGSLIDSRQHLAPGAGLPDAVQLTGNKLSSADWRYCW
jgi:hypothetical protein